MSSGGFPLFQHGAFAFVVVEVPFSEEDESGVTGGDTGCANTFLIFGLFGAPFGLPFAFG